jgi:predicted ArsR family transcriptional regulator
MASKQGPKMSEPTHEDVLARFEQCYQQNSWPWVETKEVAEVFDASYKTVRQRLDDLHERGDIERRKVSGTKVWYKCCQSTFSNMAASPSSDK